jgi:alcohol dehydrogenase (cytochrome c)
MVTDDAHLLALNRSNGEVLWDTQLADWHQNYNATSAPLVVGNLIITGSAGGEEGVRGFVAAFDQSGKEVWRFWTVPAPGEPGSQTWTGKGIEHGGAVAWLTGVYDAETDTVFWPTGNPGNDYNGDDRGGDNLYSDCILALDPKTGKLKWYYQTTPHDVWDWDASETPLVIDAPWKGHPRKLLAQGNRNGYFYVLDRTTGKLLLAQPFTQELTWASGIAADGRPIKTPGQEPSVAGTRVCPAQSGATNWYAPSYSPDTGLFYMQTNEKCSIFYKKSYEFEYGRAFLGGTQRIDSNPKPLRILRAVDLQSGAVQWETPQVGTSTTAGGTLATATGLVFFGDDSGALAAADASTGKTLWTFEAGANWRASPMAYQFDGRELIGVASGGSIIAFGLPD